MQGDPAPVAVGVQHGARGVAGIAHLGPRPRPWISLTWYGVLGMPIMRKTSAVTVFVPPVPMTPWRTIAGRADVVDWEKSQAR